VGNIARVGTNGHLLAVPGKKGGRQMEPVAYSDQLIGVLRQMRARVIAERADPELPQMTALLGALDIAFRWSGNRRPAPLPPGAGLREIGDYASRYAVSLGLEEELVGLSEPSTRTSRSRQSTMPSVLPKVRLSSRIYQYRSAAQGVTGTGQR